MHLLARYRSLAVGALATIVAAGALVGVAPINAAEVSGKPAECPSKVFVIGDSLTDPSQGGAGNYVRRVFRRLEIKADAYGKGGLSTRGALQERYGAGFGSERARKADAWVVALGTNDRAGHAFKKNVSRVVRLAKKQKVEVWWVNTSRPRSWPQGPGAPVNRILREQAKKYKRLHMINYHKKIRQRSHLLAGDKVHLTTRGSKWLARLDASPFAGCAKAKPEGSAERSLQSHLGVARQLLKFHRDRGRHVLHADEVAID